MKRIKIERNYWNTAALDPDVDSKYICDLDDKGCLEAVGQLHGRVLEIGCGVGRLMKQNYYGIDISEKMIALAKNKKPGSQFLLCNGRKIPFEKGYFDAVYCVLVFQHIPFKAVSGYIKETARVLKNKGKFIFQFIEGKEDELFSKHHSLKKIIKVLEENGFDLKKTLVKKKLVHHQWTWIKTVWQK